MRQFSAATQLTLQKAELRTEMKQIRASLSAAYRSAASRTIFANLLKLDEATSARSVFSYISHGNEVDTRVLLRHFLDKGMMVAVPKILPVRTMIATRFTCWEDLVPGELGILTPPGAEPCPGPFDIVITPGLGFTVAGQRLGYGRGYYDSWFARHRTATKIALAFEVQVISEIPHNEHDIPVDILITEKRIIII